MNYMGVNQKVSRFKKSIFSPPSPQPHSLHVASGKLSYPKIGKYNFYSLLEAEGKITYHKNIKIPNKTRVRHFKNHVRQ